MKPLNFTSVEDVRAYASSYQGSSIKLGVFDIDGVLRGKYVSKAKFLSALDGGLGFCDVVLGWDSNDKLYDNVQLTGWHTGYPDAQVRIIPQSGRHLPLENGLFFLTEFVGTMEQICPRGVLRRVIDRAKAMGFEPYSALEYEFFVFDETPHSVRDKGFRNLKPWTPGNFGYSVLRSSVYSDFYDQLMQLSQAMNFEIEGLHTETGPGVLEAAIAVDRTLYAADKAALFKTFCKVLAERRDLMATFMAKWSPEHAGQSGHIHLSLQDERGENIFYDPGSKYFMS